MKSETKVFETSYQGKDYTVTYLHWPNKPRLEDQLRVMVDVVCCGVPICVTSLRHEEENYPLYIYLRSEMHKNAMSGSLALSNAHYN